MRSPATTIWAALLAGTAIAAIGQDTCGWTGSGVDPTNWMEPTNWSCSGGAWPGDCPGDHARLDAGPPVDVTIPAGLVLGDIGVTRSGDVVRAGAGSLNVDNILGAGAFDATVATPATVNNDVMVGTFLAPSASINVTGSFVVADSFDHNGGGVNLLAGPAALRGAPSPGFATLNVQSAYTLVADTRAAIVAVTVGGDLNVDDHVLTIGTSLDITFATGFGFFGGSGTVVLRDDASWITGGAQLTPDNGVIVFEGGGPPIPAETWGHVEVAGARSAGNALMMQALTIPAGGSFDTNSFDLTVSPFGVAGGGTLVTAPPSAVNIDGGITVANLVHNDNPISLIGPGPIGAGLTFYDSRPEQWRGARSRGVDHRRQRPEFQHRWHRRYAEQSHGYGGWRLEQRSYRLRLSGGDRDPRWRQRLRPISSPTASSTTWTSRGIIRRPRTYSFWATSTSTACSTWVSTTSS